MLQTIPTVPRYINVYRPTFTIQLLQKFLGGKMAKFLASLPTPFVYNYIYTRGLHTVTNCDVYTGIRVHVKMLRPIG